MILNLYLMVSPIGVKNSELKIKQYGRKEEEKDVLLNLSKASFEKGLWDEELSFEEMDYNSKHKNMFVKLIFQYRRIIYSRQIFDVIKRKIEDEKIIKFNLYFQHLGDPLTNLIFFYKWATVFEAHIIEDGVANYYNYYDAVSSARRTMKKKRMFHKLFGFDFKVPESLCGINYEVTKSQFVRHPSLSTCPEKSKILNDTEIHFEPIKNRILILGQEGYMNFYGLESYKKAINELFLTVNLNYGNPEIIYKPHWNSDVTVVRENGNIKLLETQESIENIIHQIRPSVLISFSSSALVNIAWACKSMVLKKELVVFYRKAFKIAPEIEVLFKNVGVKRIL